MSITIAMRPKHKSGYFSKMFAKILENKLPRSFKRLIYVSSILGLIQKMRDPDMVLVGKLNEVFKLAEYPDAFAFPMYIKSVIWKNASTEQICFENGEQIDVGDLIKKDLTAIQCTAIGRHFASQAPSWLKYGSMDLMVNDIVMLIKRLREFSLEEKMKAA
jgi:hypothetical protein